MCAAQTLPWGRPPTVSRAPGHGPLATHAEAGPGPGRLPSPLPGRSGAAPGTQPRAGGLLLGLPRDPCQWHPPAPAHTWGPAGWKGLFSPKGLAGAGAEARALTQHLLSAYCVLGLVLAAGSWRRQAAPGPAQPPLLTPCVGWPGTSPERPWTPEPATRCPLGWTSDQATN